MLSSIQIDGGESEMTTKGSDEWRGVGVGALNKYVTCETLYIGTVVLIFHFLILHWTSFESCIKP